MIKLSIFEFTIALLGGGALGAIFFGGLKLTVESLITTPRPALLLVTSVTLRFAIVLGAVYWMLFQMHWQALLLALAGFIYARLIFMRLYVGGAHGEH